MSSVAKWQDDQEWAQAEVYSWLWRSLEIEIPGPDDPGTRRTLGAIEASVNATDGDNERIGALLAQLTFAGRALIHALATAANVTPEAALGRLIPGPPESGYDIGGGRI